MKYIINKADYNNPYRVHEHTYEYLGNNNAGCDFPIDDYTGKFFNEDHCVQVPDLAVILVGGIL